jgi:ribosomal protein S3AE
MAEAQTKQKRKKRWFQLVAPKSMQEAILGEIPLYEASELKNKRITLNLSTIFNEMKKQNINVLFEVRNVVEGRGFAELIGCELTLSYIKRIIRRGKDKVADSFIVFTSDKKRVRVKPLIITNSKTPKSVRRALRAAIRKLLKEEFSKSNFDKILLDIIHFKLQRALGDKISKISPVRNIEVRSCKIEEKVSYEAEKKPEVKVEPKKEEPKTEKKEDKTEEKKEEKKETPKKKTPKKEKQKKPKKK